MDGKHMVAYEPDNDFIMSKLDKQRIVPIRKGWCPKAYEIVDHKLTG